MQGAKAIDLTVGKILFIFGRTTRQFFLNLEFLDLFVKSINLREEVSSEILVVFKWFSMVKEIKPLW